MPIRESTLNDMLEKLGPQYRARIQRAIRFEEEKNPERALQEWEGLVAAVQSEGKDTSLLQGHIQRVHKLCWQRLDGARREPEASGFRGTETKRDRGPEEEKGKSQIEVVQKLKKTIQTEMQNRCLTEGINLASPTEKTELTIRGILDRIIKERVRDIPEWVRRRDLMDEIVDDVLGLGVIEQYLKDPSITEILVNGTDVYYEKDGRILPSRNKYASFDEVRRIIDRIIHPINRRVDEASPMVDARLPDGCRVNIVVPPVALDGPVISIRKFSPFVLSAEALVENQSLSGKIFEFLRLCVLYRQNVLIAGKTSSGKTTLLNLMGNFIPKNERIITIEDMAELQLRQRHVVRLEARPPNIQGKGEIEIRTLFRNALHMRPDRIIVGECRGAETMDMLQAMNTGHDGSISTAHANSPRDLFARLEAMVCMSEVAVNTLTVRRQIASGIDMIIYCTRLPDGSRKVANVSEVLQGRDGEEDVVLKEIYRFEKRGVGEEGKIQGVFVATGYVPSFVAENLELSEDPTVRSLFQP